MITASPGRPGKGELIAASTPFANKQTTPLRDHLGPKRKALQSNSWSQSKANQVAETRHEKVNIITAGTYRYAGCGSSVDFQDAHFLRHSIEPPSPEGVSRGLIMVCH